MARVLAPLGTLLLGTSMLLPWWTIRYTQAQDTYLTVHVRLFQDQGAYSLHGWTVAAGATLAAAGLLVLLHVLGRGWHYEPSIMRRDLWAGAYGAAVAAATLFVWPQDMPHAWGVRTFPGGAEHASAGPGWWLALAAAACLAAAAWRMRTASQEALLGPGPPPDADSEE